MLLHSCCWVHSTHPRQELGHLSQTPPPRLGRRPLSEGIAWNRLTRSHRGFAPSPNCGLRGWGDAAVQAWGRDSPQEYKSTRTGRKWCLEAIVKNEWSRLRKPSGSSFHNKSCRNTRIVFMPTFSAQPSSLSIWSG